LGLKPQKARWHWLSKAVAEDPQWCLPHLTSQTLMSVYGAYMIAPPTPSRLCRRMICRPPLSATNLLDLARDLRSRAMNWLMGRSGNFALGQYRRGPKRNPNQNPQDREATLVPIASLRHTAVSLLEAVVMELVGHDSKAMSARYAHVGTEALAKAVAALPEILRPRLQA
jgi:hypothetical protein